MMISRHIGSPLTLRGSGEIENLQRALTNLAIASGRPAINPGPVTGDVNDSTMTALSASLGLLTEELPTWLYLIFQAALIAGATTVEAKKLTGQYASKLTIAANTAAVKFKAPSATTPTLPTTPTPVPSIFSQLFPTGWYKTPFGLLVIAAGLFGGYKLFIAK